MRAACLLSAVVFCAVLPGCTPAPKLFKVTGVLKFEGQPLKVDANGSPTISFIPIVEEGQNFSSVAAAWRPEDSSFEVLGPEGKGIPAGKYRIAIMLMVPTPTPETYDLNERFSKKNSPIVRDVTDEAPIVLELSKDEGK